MPHFSSLFSPFKQPDVGGRHKSPQIRPRIVVYCQKLHVRILPSISFVRIVSSLAEVPVYFGSVNFVVVSALGNPERVRKSVGLLSTSTCLVREIYTKIHFGEQRMYVVLFGISMLVKWRSSRKSSRR